METLTIALLAKRSFSSYSKEMITPILDDNSLKINACAIYSPKEKTLKQKLKSSWDKGRRSAILVIIIEMIIKKLKGKISSKPTISFSTKDFFESHSVEILETKRLYSPETLNFLKNSGAQVLILFEYHGIVKNEILELFPQGVLSYHYGNMRKYRGQPAAFWELYHNEPEMGVTVQLIDLGIDNGQPLEEMSIPLSRKDNLQTISDFVEKNCPQMMYVALKKVQQGYNPKPIEYGPVFTVPNLFQWIYFQIKIVFRQLMP